MNACTCKVYIINEYIVVTNYEPNPNLLSILVIVWLLISISYEVYASGSVEEPSVPESESSESEDSKKMTDCFLVDLLAAVEAVFLSFLYRCSGNLLHGGLNCTCQYISHECMYTYNMGAPTGPRPKCSRHGEVNVQQ